MSPSTGWARQQAALTEAERRAEHLEITAHWHIVDCDTDKQRTFGMAIKELPPADREQEEVTLEATYN